MHAGRTAEPLAQSSGGRHACCTDFHVAEMNSAHSRTARETRRTRDLDVLQEGVPMADRLNGRKVAILATDGFEESELKEPLRALKDAGADTKIVSLTPNAIRGWKHGNWSDPIEVDVAIGDAKATKFDALVLPGGVMNPDTLRQDGRAVKFVKQFFDDGKPVAAICHGPWMLAEADVARDRKLTSYASIRTDLENAGAKWVDEEVVVDQGLVTSRSPADLKAFCEKLVEEIAEGVHAGQTA
jgi:deglycase